MAWTWRYHGPATTSSTGAGAPPAPQFPTQGDAETWIGETWRDLLSAGVERVSLVELGPADSGQLDGLVQSGRSGDPTVATGHNGAASGSGTGRVEYTMALTPAD